MFSYIDKSRIFAFTENSNLRSRNLQQNKSKKIVKNIRNNNKFYETIRLIFTIKKSIFYFHQEDIRPKIFKQIYIYTYIRDYIHNRCPRFLPRIPRWKSWNPR